MNHKQQFDSALTEAVQSTDELSSVVKNAEGQLEFLRKAVTELSSNSQAIEKIAQAIEQIAKGIQIVAINASIESTRAGESGAAFGVVAEEVERMAQHCNVSVKEIRSLIESNCSTMLNAERANNGMNQQIEAVRDTQTRVVQQLNIIQYHADSLHQSGESGLQVERSELLVFDPEKYGTGVQSVDEQHKKLFEMVNDLDRACREGHGKNQIDEMLDFLGKYVVDHFQNEEQLMAVHRCPATSKNKQAHSLLLSKYAEWRDQYETSGASLSMVRDLHSLLKGWLVEHIMGTDSCLKDCVKHKVLTESKT